MQELVEAGVPFHLINPGGQTWIIGFGSKHSYLFAFEIARFSPKSLKVTYHLTLAKVRGTKIIATQFHMIIRIFHNSKRTETI